MAIRSALTILIGIVANDSAIFPVFLLTVILALDIQAAEIRLPKTGQAACFDGGWGSSVEFQGSGQDGEYRTWWNCKA